MSSVCSSVRQFPTTKAKSQPAASNLHPSRAESFTSLSYSWLVCLAKSSQLLKQQRRERLRICQKETSTHKSVVMELLPILTVMGTSSLPLKVYLMVPNTRKKKEVSTYCNLRAHHFRLHNLGPHHRTNFVECTDHCDSWTGLMNSWVASLSGLVLRWEVKRYKERQQ